MTEHKQRIAIARWMGDTCQSCQLSLSDEMLPDTCSCVESCVPDYTRDLNAMHEAETVLMKRPVNVWKTYASFIAKSAHNEWGSSAHEADFAHVTAAQRTEAMLRTLNLWRDEAPAPTL